MDERTADQNTLKAMYEYKEKLEEVRKALDDREKANEARHLDQAAKIDITHDAVKVRLQEKLTENLEKKNEPVIKAAEDALVKNEETRGKDHEKENKRYGEEKKDIEAKRTELDNKHKENLNERSALDKELPQRTETAQRLVQDGLPADPLLTAAKAIETAGPVVEKVISKAAEALTGLTYEGLPKEVSKEVYKTAAFKVENAIESHNQKIDQQFLENVKQDVAQAPSKLVSEQTKELESMKKDFQITKEEREKDKVLSR